MELLEWIKIEQNKLKQKYYGIFDILNFYWDIRNILYY